MESDTNFVTPGNGLISLEDFCFPTLLKNGACACTIVPWGLCVKPRCSAHSGCLCALEASWTSSPFQSTWGLSGFVKAPHQPVSTRTWTLFASQRYRTQTDKYADLTVIKTGWGKEGLHETGSPKQNLSRYAWAFELCRIYKKIDWYCIKNERANFCFNLSSHNYVSVWSH